MAGFDGTAYCGAVMRSRAATIAVALSLLVGTVLGAAPTTLAPALEPRLVVIKVDGLPQSAVDKYVARIDHRTGRSALPWIRHLFYDSGIRVANFYSRGISLSEPSWAIIDTGQHSIIKGNFEVDRSTGDSIDHLSFVGFYADSVRSRRVFPSGVEALDAARTPLTSDAWRFEDRDTGIQLLRRGTRWFDLLKVGVDPARSGSIGERIGDLIVGVNEVEVWSRIAEQSFLKALLDPRIRYADLYWPYIDEAIHDDNSEASVLGALVKFDRMLGRAQQAIAQSGTADRTVLVVVSDHGATYDSEGLYSQGVNLISYLERPEFGAHHTISRGGPLANYELKGSAFQPFASGAALSSSRHSAYLADRPDQVTCAIDYDGNERAQIHFRDPDLNRLQILWRSIRHGRLDDSRRATAARGALAILERRRAGWQLEASELAEEVGALERRASALRFEQLRLDTAIARGKKEKADRNATPRPALAPFAGASALNCRDPHEDIGKRAKELVAELYRVERLRLEYAAQRDRLLARVRITTPEAFAAASDVSLFGLRELGRHLSAVDLMAYPVGLRDLVVDASGAFDEQASFATVNYLERFSGIRVRNSTRAELGAAPVSWLAAELPVPATLAAIASHGGDVDLAAAWTRAFLVYADSDRQLLMLYRMKGETVLAVTLIPIANLAVDSATGACAFEQASWRPGLPFALFEDPYLDTSGLERAAWLSAPHSIAEWRDAAHRTAEGLAVAGLTEVYSTAYRQTFDELIARATDPDARLLLRFERRRRDGVATDLFLHASPMWNFDLKDFNAGGNHGGFARESMHTVFWMRGGPATRLKVGPAVIDRPYDGLDVAPTLFEVAGQTTGGTLTDDLRRGGYRDFPGRIVTEAFRP